MDFEINSQQRSVSKNSRTIDLSKKSFDMLLFLLQRQGELITKNELSAAVWPNQFITDSALNKQISRLRNTFDVSDCNESIIETVRGIGIRLVVDVEMVGDKSKNFISRRFTWKVIVAIVVVIVIVMAASFLLYHHFNQSEQNNIANTKIEDIEPLITTKESINIAIVPAERTDEWLDIGGLNYLSELLQQHAEIDSINPQANWFKQDTTKVLALQLSQAENIDFSLIVKNIKKDHNFISQVTLRNKHGILANAELQATTLASLFEKMDAWTIQQLDITSGVVFTNPEHVTKVSDFALESYLRGLSAARNRNFHDAAQFLQTAVNQNKAYFPAWLLLIEVEAELGNLQKALAMTVSIENLNNFDSYYLNDLYNVKARTLIYMNKLEDAEFYLNKSMEISDQEGDMKAIIVSLSSEILIQDRTGISTDTLKIIKKQLELVKKHNPLPNLIAQINHNLAIVNQKLFNYDEARKYIEKAIEQYQRQQNHSGLVSSYRVKSNIHNDLAETGQSLLALEKAEKWLDDVDSPIVLAHYYTSKARNLYEQGYLNQANSEIDKLHALSIKYDNIEAKIIGLIIQAELQISYCDFVDARHTITQMLDIVMVNPADHPAYAEYIAIIDMYLSARTDNAVASRNKMNKYLISFPSLAESASHHLRRIEAHIFAAEGYKNKAISMLQKLMQYYISNSHYLYANYVGYEILELQWQNDMDSYLKTVNRVQEISTFGYPILKFKAKYFAYQKDFLNAAILMQELKPKAREFWTIDDQLLMEEYQQKAQGVSKI